MNFACLYRFQSNTASIWPRADDPPYAGSWAGAVLNVVTSPLGTRALFPGGREHNGCAGRDVGAGSHPCEQVLEVAWRGHPGLEDVALLPRDRVAGLKVRDVTEAVRDIVGGGGVQGRHRDERDERRPQLIMVDHGAVAPDHPALLESAHPLVNRRCRQPGDLAEIGE